MFPPTCECVLNARWRDALGVNIQPLEGNHLVYAGAVMLILGLVLCSTSPILVSGNAMGG